MIPHAPSPTWIYMDIMCAGTDDFMRLLIRLHIGEFAFGSFAAVFDSVGDVRGARICFPGKWSGRLCSDGG